MKSVLWILLLAVLALAIRGHNIRNTVIDGRIYFVDADCYSRMTRAAIVDEHPGTIVRHHDFENFPTGVDPHTTVPLDYLIVALKRLLSWIPALQSSILGNQMLDVAGALISPLLGLLTSIALGIWARWCVLQKGENGVATLARNWSAATGMLVFAISPILVHGTVLGRPDHQSLLILLVAIALMAEWATAGLSPKGWSCVAGAAWGLALWVSVYEPIILLVAVSLFRWLERFVRSSQPAKEESEQPWKWSIIATVVIVAFIVERWHFRLLDESLKTYFGNWGSTIGELRHLSPRKPALYRWLSWLCLASPVLLVLAARRDRRAISLLGMVLLCFGLTCWQLRWGYFLALVFAISLPWQLAVFPRRWIAWVVLIVALWPTWKEWDEQLYPSEAAQKQFGVRALELTQMRQVAEAMKTQPPQGFIAPWWLSPPIAYWSGQLGVAGSSHESLGGIVDTAKFYTAGTPAEAEAILRVRKVGWVVADDPARILSTSQAILGIEPPASPFATPLAESPKTLPDFLQEVPFAADVEGRPQFFRLYRVKVELANHE